MEHGAQHIFAATSLKQAREHLRTEVDIGLVFLDLKLDDGWGLDLVGELQERKIPILITTGYELDSKTSVPVLYKPYPPAALIAIAFELLGQDFSQQNRRQFRDA